jgi:peptide/nickel transport system substrate-binding protein
MAVTDATSSGLVRLDRDGQVIAGAAARWAILDDGLDYIFRIDDNAGVSAPEIARRLRAAIRPRRGQPGPLVAGMIESIAAVTGTVVEIRLTAPQAALLTLLGDPAYGVGARGPMEARSERPAQALLATRTGTEPRPMPVLLRAEPVGRAVARFVAGASDLVLGGRFADLPVVHVARPPRGGLRFDPVAGLFGFVLKDAAGPAADARVRAALGLAIDRDRIVAAIGAGKLAKATTLAGSEIERPLADRRAEAVELIGDRRMTLRVAMPEGPGARLLFRQVARDWASIGVTASAVAADAPADLALIDVVTPPGSRAFMACMLSAACDPGDRLALIDPPFIPIAAPVRWSLVARRLDLFQENNLAAHPLDRLRSR